MPALKRRGRPRLAVDEAAIIGAYLTGTPILQLAHDHGVDRYVIRRVLDDYNVPRINYKRRHPPRDVEAAS